MLKINSAAVEESVTNIIKAVGEDLNREGLKETPKRVAKKYSEILSGYSLSPEDVLSKRFKEESGFPSYVWLKNIEFHSLCEHHMLPVSGFVDVCYIPDKFVVGLSKLARIVDVFSKRLQLQERMNMQIADSIQNNLGAKGVAVRVSAKHYCMVMRGVEKQNAVMQTFHFTGVFKDTSIDNIYRKEFFDVLRSS